MKRFLLVSGAPRSGTTLMMQVLNLHPRIALFYESNLPALISSFENLFWKEKKDNIKDRWLTPRETYSTSTLKSWTPKKDRSWELLTEALWRPVFPDKWWDKGDVIVGDKWNLIYTQPKLMHLLPKHGIRLLWMERDPVDCVASWVKKETNEGLRKIGRQDLIFEALANCAMAKSFVDFAEKQNIKMLRVSYERFCREPMTELDRVCEFLEVRTTEVTKGAESRFFSRVPEMVTPSAGATPSERREIESAMGGLAT